MSLEAMAVAANQVVRETNSGVGNAEKNAAANNVSASAASVGAVSSKKEGQSEKISAPAIQVASNTDRVSISEKGKSQENDKKQVEQVEAPKETKPFETTPVSSNTVAFKKTDQDQFVMQIIDNETDKVLKQYPPEELQRVSRFLSSFVDSMKPQESESFSSVA